MSAAFNAAPATHPLPAMLVSASVVFLHAQGRGSNEWTTSGFDAQRSSWLRGDARLTKDAVQKGEFAYLWSMKLENANRQLNSLTPPVLLDRLIGYRGFKSLAFVGGSDDRVFAVDTDLARPTWTTVLNYSAPTGGRPSSSMACPGGLTAMPSRRTALAIAAPIVGGGGRGGVRNGSAVGEPGKGRSGAGPAAWPNVAPLLRRQAVDAVPRRLASAASTRCLSWAATASSIACTSAMARRWSRRCRSCRPMPSHRR